MTRFYAPSLLAFMFAGTAVLAADVSGIWAGQIPGRTGDLEDVAFKFKLDGQVLTGKMFGDEFDLNLDDGSVSGDQIKFAVTTTNYYSGNKVKFVFNGLLKGKEIELTRERMPDRSDEDAESREKAKRTFKLKRLT